MNIGFVGAGRVGTALALALSAKGYPVTAIASRTHGSAEQLAARLGQGAMTCASAQAVADACDIVFVTTPDDAIPAVAAQVRWRKGQRVIHCSGGLSMEALAPARAMGAEVAGFHPLQSFASAAPSRVTGITIGLEGAGPVLAVLQEMAEALGARWIVVPSEGKAVYHAAAVCMSNYVVTLASTAEDLFTSLGIPRGEALPALLTLLEGTAQNLREQGIPRALTGPIARGDVGTVQKHMRALTQFPEVANLYRALGERTVPIARAKGTVNGEQAKELLRVLGVRAAVG